jgi:hypothetical protein
VRVGRLAWLVPGGLLLGAIGARLALRYAPGETATGLAQPFAIVTAWHGYGAFALALLIVAVGIGAIGYVATLRAQARGDELPLASIVVVAACALVAAVAWPFAFSSDVYAYAAYGDLASHGIDPYAPLVASTAPGDATMRAALWQWSDALPVCVYGPFFVWIARSLGSLVALRLLACAALLACAPLAYDAFAGRPRNQRLWAASAIALNPVVLWSAAEGHNDALVVAIGLAAFAIARRYGTFLGGLIASFSLGIKAVGGLAMIGLVATYPKGRAGGYAALGLLIGLAAVLNVYHPYLGDVAASHRAHGPYLPLVSLQAIWPPLGIAAAIAAVAFGILTLIRRDPAGWLFAALGLWLAIPNPQPWYGLWFLPIAALAPRSIAAWVLVGLSLTTLLRYYPDAVGIPSYPLDVVLSSLAFAPLLLLCLHLRSKP